MPHDFTSVAHEITASFSYNWRVEFDRQVCLCWGSRVWRGVLALQCKCFSHSITFEHNIFGMNLSQLEARSDVFTFEYRKRLFSIHLQNCISSPALGNGDNSEQPDLRSGRNSNRWLFSLRNTEQITNSRYLLGRIHVRTHIRTR